VHAVEAWNAGVTGAGVRVCVLDAGFDMSHPDLVDNINQELSINFTGDSPDGRPDYLLQNAFSHGSHVAGIIAASNSKSPLVLQPGSIVSPPLSTHHVILLILVVTPTSDGYGTIGVAPDAELVL
jgi:subtilisin family serine protease